MGLRRLEDRRCYITRKQNTQVGKQPKSDFKAVPILLSATTQVQYKTKSTASSNPVSSGNDSTDHLTNHNDVITIKGVVSDTPVLLSSRSGLKREKYVTMLDNIRKKKEIVDVFIYELGGSIKDCVITSISYSKQSSLGDGLGVTVNLKKILVGIGGTVTSSEDTADITAPDENSGPKPSESSQKEHPVNSYASPK